MLKVKRQMKSPINFIKKIKLLFRNDSQIETEKFLISQKSCPHCASRGMFIFNNISINSDTIKKVKPKDQCQSDPVED